MKKLFRSIVLILAFTMFFSITVFADTTGSGTSNSEGSVDAHSSVSGFSKLRSGYLVYVTNSDGVPVSDVILVPFASPPASNVRRFLTTRVTGSSCTMTYNGTISSATNNGFNKPAIDTTTGATFGESMKSWLIADNGAGSANAYVLIKNLFGEEFETSFAENDYYLCVEAVCWLGLQSSNNPVMIAGTTKTLNEKFRQAGSSYMNYFRQCRLPHSGYMEHDWAGCTIPTIHEGQKENITDLTAILEKYNVLEYIDVCYEYFNSMGEYGILDELKCFIEEQGGNIH